LAATTYGGGIYTNANSGAGDWIPTSAPTSLNWFTIASSSDGTKLAAAAPPGGIWTIDLSAPIIVQGTSTTFTGIVGITYSVSVAATIGGNSSISSPSPLTSPLSAATGCILWLDGADPNATGISANGTTITTWKDKSGNGNDATSQSGTIFIINNGLRFDGTKYLYVPNISGKLVNTPFVVFVVETLTGPNSYGLFFGDDNTSVPGRGVRLHLGYRNWGNVTMGFWGDMDIEDYSMIAQTGETRIWAFYLATGGGATARFIRRNGNNDQVSLGSSTYTYLSHFITPCIGRIAQGYSYTGQIAEILVFPTDIGIPAIQRVEQYLANKWKVSSKSGIITPIATPTVVSAAANGGTITVTCGTPTTGTVLNIPTIPTGLTLSGYTTTTFTYTGAAAATPYPFLVYGYNGPAISSVVSTSATPLYTPGTPTVTAVGTTVNITWTYEGSATGITFNVRDGNNNWAGTSVPGVLTTSFTGESGKSYSIFVFATSGLNRSANSAATSTTIVVLGPVTFTQNYQLTTQTKIVGTAAATGAASYSGTTDSTSALSLQTPAGAILTWTQATGGTRYNGVTIGAAAGAATTSIANQSLYSAFDPKTISSCVLWLDAADPNATGVPAANGATISIWKDKSGLGRDGTATGGPTISSTGLNGNPTMNFNGSSWFDGLTTNTGTTMTVFMVMQQPAPTSVINPNYTRVFSMGPSSGVDYQTAGFFIGFVGPPGYQVPGPTVVPFKNNVTPGFPQPVNTPYITDIVSDGSTIASYINGTVKMQLPSTGNFGIGRYRIGGEIGNNTGTKYTGYVSEVLIYNAALTTIQRQLVERYLAWKWGLQTQLDPGFPLNNFPGTLPLPNTIQNLSLWLDAADTTTITKNGAGNLLTIKDKSGTNNSWTAGGTAVTTFGTIGGVQCITFTDYGSKSYITGTYTLTQGQNLTIFMAFNNRVDNLTASQVSLFDSGPSIIFNEGGQLQLVNQTNYTLNYTSPTNIPASSNNTYVVAITSSITSGNTASSFAVVNGTVYNPMTAGGYNYVASGSSTFTASTFAYNPWSLGELVVYSGVLTNAQIQQVAGYLIYKWKAY
jgi:hypothetical protein